MSKMEFTTSDQRRTETVPLTLDIDQRLDLSHELRDLSAELQENPFIKPSKSVTELSGIVLRRLGVRSPALSMSMKVLQSDSEPSSAVINLHAAQVKGGAQSVFIHRPSYNQWEEWRGDRSEVFRVMSDASLVTTLEPHLPEGALDPIMDQHASGMEVARLLADSLKNRARSRTQHLHYKAHHIEVDDEYSRDTDFVIKTANQRIARNLIVAASFDLDDFGHVRKAYHFNVAHQGGNLKAANGTVSVSAGEQVPATRLRAFGLRDPIRNNPSEAIKIGANDIRNAYSAIEL